MVVDRGNLRIKWLGLSLLAACCGCGSSDPTPSATDSNATVAATQSSDRPAAIRYDRPEKTVEEFLTALKSGDQPRATSMLTLVAQEEMAKTEAMIQPPGSSTATFTVTQTEILGQQQDGAHVLSVWSDTSADGTKTNHEIVWILRREPEGWAVAGFATQVFPDQPPLILNFEDPLELQRKRDLVDAEIERRQAPQTVQQAELPADTIAR
jgi:hypothetical protein